ncbi:MFS transporter, partial [Streptomyces cavourensis]
TGIGLVMSVLVLAVQNSVRPADLGTATSANNYFRQIGGSVGAAVFGTLFAGRLSDSLGVRLPTGVELPPPESITPQLVHAMEPALRDAYIQAYVDAMPRIFLYLVPVLVLGLILAFFLKEKPLVSHHSPEAATEPAPIPAARANPPRPSVGYLSGVPVQGTVRHPDGTPVEGSALTLIDVQGQQVGRGSGGGDGR